MIVDVILLVLILLIQYCYSSSIVNSPFSWCHSLYDCCCVNLVDLFSWYVDDVVGDQWWSMLMIDDDDDDDDDDDSYSMHLMMTAQSLQCACVCVCVCLYMCVCDNSMIMIACLCARYHSVSIGIPFDDYSIVILLTQWSIHSLAIIHSHLSVLIYSVYLVVIHSDVYSDRLLVGVIVVDSIHC